MSRRMIIAFGLAALLAVPDAVPAGAVPLPPPPPPGRILGELSTPRAAPDPAGTRYREFTTTLPDPRGGPVRGDVVEVDLADPAVRVDLLRPPVVAATRTVPDMGAGAIAGVNGGFFDQGGSGAPVSVQIVEGTPRSSGVPAGRRPAPPPPPGESAESVIGFDRSGRGHIGRVMFAGEVRSGSRSVPLRGVNGYAVPDDGVGVFTSAWGGADRARSTCGSDTDAAAPCAADAVEVRVEGGHVSAVGAPGAGPLPRGTVALVGRDAGAVALRALRVGDPADVRYALTAPDTPPLRVALGALPLTRDGAVLPGAQDTERAPRTAVGLSDDGRRMWLITVDGRMEESIGATLSQLGRLVVDLGVRDAVALDGGGSTTMVRTGAGEGPAVVNSPSDGRPREVADGLGVFPG